MTGTSIVTLGVVLIIISTVYWIAVRRRAETLIESAGGIIMYSHELSGNLGDDLTWHGPVTGLPQWLICLFGKTTFYNPMFVAMSADSPDESDSARNAIRSLVRFPSIVGLHLNGLCIVDDDIRTVRASKSLRFLRLEYTSATNISLPVIMHLPRLKELQLLNNPQIDQVAASSFLSTHSPDLKVRF